MKPDEVYWLRFNDSRRDWEGLFLITNTNSVNDIEILELKDGAKKRWIPIKWITKKSAVCNPFYMPGTVNKEQIELVFDNMVWDDRGPNLIQTMAKLKLQGRLTK